MEYIQAEKILHAVSYDKEKWFGIDYNMNLYRGCNHGCIYCDSRSNCYGIHEFDSVKVKENCINKLNRELAHKRKRGIIGIGSMSDTYNLFEKRYQITRQALELIAKYGFGVSIDTKSNLVCRDIDLLQKITSSIVKVTITTPHDTMSQWIEPHAPKTSQRLKAVEELSSKGIFTGILLMPVLPFITDSKEDIKRFIALAHQYGAKFIFPMFGVTLRDRQREYFYSALEKRMPEVRNKYISVFGNQYYCLSPDSEKLFHLFQYECQCNGILYRMNDIIKAYKHQGDTQLTLSWD